MDNGRLVYLDGLKGLAILLVVMIHTGASSLPSLWGDIGDFGKYGVQLFFIISTCLSLKSYEKKNGSISKWILLRLLRLSPIYYLALFVYYFTYGGVETFLGPDTNVSFLNILAHMLFVHGFFPNYINSIIGVEWYIGTLVVVYMCIPIIFKLVSDKEKSLSFVFISIIVSFFIGKFFSCVFSDSSYPVRTYINTFSLIAQLPAIALGTNLYFILKKRDFFPSRSFIFIMGCFSILIVAGFVLKMNIILGVTNIAMASICLYLLLLLCIFSPLQQRLWGNLFFRYIGKHSFIYYLFHIYVFRTVNSFVLSDNLWSWLLVYSITITITSFLVMPIEFFNEYVNAKLLHRLVK